MINIVIPIRVVDTIDNWVVYGLRDFLIDEMTTETFLEEYSVAVGRTCLTDVLEEIESKMERLL